MNDVPTSDAPTAAMREGLRLAENPHWGQGATRRRVSLSGTPGMAVARLGDHNHAMQCLIRHDTRVVTSVEPLFRRVTLNHCAGAAVPVQEIIGMPIGIGTADFFAGGRARRNCTHMLDLAWLALRHACRPHGERLYDIFIPDAPDGRMTGELRRDGKLVLRWDVERGRIVAPATFAGQSLAGGFTGWVLGQSGLEDDDLEAALVLHKGFFMVGSRQFHLPPGPVPQADRAFLAGVCHGYAAERIDQARRVDNMFTDFTDRPDDLLRF